MTKRRALGRGLDALLGDAVKAEGAPPREGVTKVAVADIQPGKYQPRRHFDKDELEALADPIREKGVLQPVLVRPLPNAPGRYELIAGERRWQASQRAGLHEVPVIVRAFADRDALEIALVENIQRQDLSPLEEAEGFQRLMDEFHHTQEELAAVVGKSRSHIANTLRLLNLPAAVQEMVQTGTLSAGHARAVLTADDPEALARRIVEQDLTVRDAEALAKVAEKPKAKRPKSKSTKDSDTVALERRIASSLGLKAEVRAKKRGGELVLRYSSLDQLDEVLGRLGVEIE